MGLGVFQKIIKSHLIEGEMIAGKSIGIKIDQTLTQDTTGTMVYLEFEALGIPQVKTELSVSYVDHNLLQNGYKNADDHRFIQSSASKYGAYFSRPGNGICHQLHLERFSVPGKTLLGSDSHTPTCGGIGMIAIGAGGLDVALAMAGNPFHMKMPQVVNVILTGKLKPFVSAKDIILYLLKKLSVKGGINKVFEFTGSGVSSLHVSERATITNMGAELGATTSIFPSDNITYEFMKLQKRESDWVEIVADKDAIYDQSIEIILDSLEPMVAQPHSPDNVLKIRDIAGKKVDQVAIGSCTNSSLRDLMKVAQMLKGRRIHPEVSVALNPGSRQVVRELVRRGALDWLLSAGVRILEMGCGPCVGIGFSPRSKGVSLRTFNRNFPGRSGTKDAQVFLVSPESAVAATITGKITDPRDLGIEYPEIDIDKPLIIDDSMIISPSKHPDRVKIERGPNIISIPLKSSLSNYIQAKVQLKLGNNISTDDILPAGTEIMSLRSNLPKISEYTFRYVNPDFFQKMKKDKTGIIVGGNNYGQGSSREHAALVVMYLGIQTIIVKSFARIHRDNLINSGILPLIFKNEEDFNKIEQGDMLAFETNHLKSSDIQIKNISKNYVFEALHDLNEREKTIVWAGGILPYYKNKKLN
jgi:aconitate hydratase